MTTTHVVRASNLRHGDAIQIDGVTYVVFAAEPLTGSVVEVHYCHPDRPDFIVGHIRLFNDLKIEVTIRD